MPNCPVCGKEVQASTMYCPACGASLNQASGAAAMPSGNYSPTYSYSQPGMGGQPVGQSHSHRKYIIAIILVGIIGLVAGGLMTGAFLIGPDVTDVTGSVVLNDLDMNTYHGTVSSIFFGSADTGNLSSTVLPNHSYQTYLPIGETYTVVIQWTNVTAGSVATYSCAAIPGTFSSNNANETQNFSC